MRNLSIVGVTTIVSIIVPIFGLIAIGYLAARLRYFSSSTVDGLSAFVLGIATPTLLFRTVATAQFGAGNALSLWLAYFAGVIVVAAIAVVLARRMGGADRRTSVIAGVSASYANLVLVGIPTIERVYGREGLDVLSLLLAVHLPLMITVSTLLVERAAMRDALDGAAGHGAFSNRAALRRSWDSLSRNALVIGILAGIAWRSFGLPVSGIFGEIVGSVAGTAGPLALIVLGLSLPRYKLGRTLGLPAILTVLALLVQPGVVFLVGAPFLPPVWLGVAVLAAAGPSGVNAYVLAAHFKCGEQLAATVTVTTTVASAATLGFWIWLFAA